MCVREGLYACVSVHMYACVSKSCDPVHLCTCYLSASVLGGVSVREKGEKERAC